MRAAIYARYSSDLQSAASVEDQLRLCEERAIAEGWGVAGRHSDRGISGASLMRPGLQDLMQSAARGEFDIVIAEALDRLSRDQEDIAGLFKRLGFAGVRIVTLAEGDVSELHIGLKGTMNALFLKDLAQKTRRGQRGRVEAGKIPGGNSYGYRMLRALKDDGSVTTGEREVDETEAAIVRRIFAEYAAGLPPRRIAAGLNRESVPSPRGGLWNASTINGSRQRQNGILNNALYLGRITYNRQRFIKDPATGKRVSRPNPEALWVTREVSHLRIIDDATWAAVQAIKARYGSQAGNMRQTKKRLLSGLVRCGACGGAMTIVNRERYSCSARRERGTCSSPTSIRAEELEDRVLNGLRSILLGREAMLAEFAAAYRAELDRLRRTRGTRRSELEKELAKVERGVVRCLAFITEGDGDPGAVRDTLRELEQRKRALRKELTSEGRGGSTVEIHPNVAELYRRKVAELQTLLADEATRTQATDIIRGLVERIEIRAGRARGQVETSGNPLALGLRS